MSSRSSCKRNQHGGGLGSSYEFKVPSFAPSVQNPIAMHTVSSCGTVPITPLTNTGPKGLPGMSGGRRKGKSRKVQRGGRYGFGVADGIGGTPWGTGIASAVHIPCEASRQPHVSSDADGLLNTRGQLWDGPVGKAGVIQNGGALSLGSPFLNVPTARYTVNTDPPIVSAAGTNLAINRPLNWQNMNPACLKTGGSRKNRSKKNRSKKNRSKKSRKVNRR